VTFTSRNIRADGSDEEDAEAFCSSFIELLGSKELLDAYGRGISTDIFLNLLESLASVNANANESPSYD